MHRRALRRRAFVFVSAVLVFALPGAAMAAQERVKRLSSDESVSKKRDLQKPPVVPHPEEAPESASS